MFEKVYDRFKSEERRAAALGPCRRLRGRGGRVRLRLRRGACVVAACLVGAARQAPTGGACASRSRRALLVASRRPRRALLGVQIVQAVGVRPLLALGAAAFALGSGARDPDSSLGWMIPASARIWRMMSGVPSPPAG
jgi:hypothetical protein